ncbi:MAG: hypothetical protein IH872_13405 [Chloroflexi bacterium]|nr:hypothetical protein [Chloroflexota bacterium]
MTTATNIQADGNAANNMTEKKMKDDTMNSGKNEIIIIGNPNSTLVERISTFVASMSLGLAFVLVGGILGLAVNG